MNFQVYPRQWLSLDPAVRQVLARELSIKASGQRSVVVEKGRHSVVSDGHTVADLLNITTAALQNFTGSDSTDDQMLWNLAVEKATKMSVPASVTTPEPEPETEQDADATKKPGRPKKVIADV